MQKKLDAHVLVWFFPHVTHGKIPNTPKIRAHTYRDALARATETWFIAAAVAAAVILAALNSGCAASGAIGSGAQATSGAEGTVNARVNAAP